ncbi:hypothetical protein C2E23DRAFT_820480 [Lenzites betulinus]|nr:hypothetical protein C2E23DRAFT_820480 [Lenzites betulinus]
MSYSEDAQPNEVRHARKGNARVPAIRTSRLTAGPQQHRGYTPQRGRPFYRGSGRGFANTSSGQVASGSNRAPGSFVDGPANRSINRGSHPSLSWRGSTPDMGRSRTHQPNQSWRRHGLNNANATYGTTQTVISKAENLDPLPLPAQLEPMRVESASEVPMIVDSTSMDYDIPPEATPPNIRRAASSLEDANRLASDSRPSWPFDPKQPSLSISLTRVFPGYVPPHVTSPGSSSYMESSAAWYPIRASPPSREYMDDDEVQSGELHFG